MQQLAAGWIGRAAEALGARRRPGAAQADLLLTRKRVYILPTRAGLLFGAVLATMLVTSINYRLSLGFALTFLLAGLGLVSMIHTWRNLVGISLRPGRGDPVQAGELAEVFLMLHNRAGPERFAIRLTVPGTAQSTLVDLAPRAEQLVAVALPTERRGWLPVPRLEVSTTFPLGLWRAWAGWQPDTRVLVHPRAETPAAPLPAAALSTGRAIGAGVGDDDFAALRPYRDGDRPNRIAWKAFARSGGDSLLTMQFDGGFAGDVWLDWQSLPIGMSTEPRLSRLARWVLDAEAAGIRYGLRLPRRTIDVDGGPVHRAACLEALALAEVDAK
jgi:uncharacterized protein (DUF58 family)